MTAATGRLGAWWTGCARHPWLTAGTGGSELRPRPLLPHQGPTQRAAPAAPGGAGGATEPAPGPAARLRRGETGRRRGGPTANVFSAVALSCIVFSLRAASTPNGISYSMSSLGSTGAARTCMRPIYLLPVL